MRSVQAESGALGAVEVVLQQRPVLRMRALVDQQAGPATRGQPAEIGQPLLV